MQAKTGHCHVDIEKKHYVINLFATLGCNLECNWIVIQPNPVVYISSVESQNDDTVEPRYKEVGYNKTLL